MQSRALELDDLSSNPSSAAAVHDAETSSITSLSPRCPLCSAEIVRILHNGAAARTSDRVPEPSAWLAEKATRRY